MTGTVKASIVGATGYSGAELFGLLQRHPLVTTDKIFAHTAVGKRLGEVLPRYASARSLKFDTYAPEAAASSDIVFVALPSGEAMNLVPELLHRGKRVIDLGGDFRLRNVSQYESFYKRSHTAPELLPNAVYGLPEWNHTAIAGAAVVANPGCYPTGAILPLAPLLKERLIEPMGIVINALSGVSGAGRSATADMSFAEVNESVRAYKVGVHQHIPEIQQALQMIADQNVDFSFVPHLIPITRGIFTTIHARCTRELSPERIERAYASSYRNAPFVRVSSRTLPELKHVQCTNFIDIGFHVDQNGGGVLLFSAIDNLVKGAAGQAVQNMNIMFGFSQTEGLL